MTGGWLTLLTVRVNVLLTEILPAPESVIVTVTGYAPETLTG